MTRAEIKEALIHYYEIDLNNCLFNSKDWVNELSKALTDKEYLNKFKEEYKNYIEFINQ